MGKLTKREEQVIALIAHGYAYKEVARQLKCSLYTICNHAISIREKLNVRGIQAAVYKRYCNYVDFPDITTA